MDVVSVDYFLDVVAVSFVLIDIGELVSNDLLLEWPDDDGDEMLLSLLLLFFIVVRSWMISEYSTYPAPGLILLWLLSFNHQKKKYTSKNFKGIAKFWILDELFS